MGTSMSIPEDVLIARIDPAARLPERANPGDAGWDLFSIEAVRLDPGRRHAVRTGISIAMPPGLVALVHARSGRARREGLALVNAPGVVDAGYRGEITVVVVNLDPHDPITISPGDRIAQVLFQRVSSVRWYEADTLPGTHRGTGGFGSSGE